LVCSAFWHGWNKAGLVPKTGNKYILDATAAAAAGDQSRLGQVSQRSAMKNFWELLLWDFKCRLPFLSSSHQCKSCEQISALHTWYLTQNSADILSVKIVPIVLTLSLTFLRESRKRLYYMIPENLSSFSTGTTGICIYCHYVICSISFTYCRLVSRRPLFTKDLHHDFIVENIIGDQKVSKSQGLFLFVCHFSCVCFQCFESVYWMVGCLDKVTNKEVVRRITEDRQILNYIWQKNIDGLAMFWDTADCLTPF